MPRLMSLNSYHYRRGGSDVVYLEHAALFERQGWKNFFFSMSHPLNIYDESSAYFIDRVDSSEKQGPRSKALAALRTIYNSQAVKRFSTALDFAQPDVIHAHCIYHHLTPAVFKEASKRSIPIVVTAHDLKIACPAYKMFNDQGLCEKCKNKNFRHVIKNKCIKSSLLSSAIVYAEAKIHNLLRSYEYVSSIICPSEFYRNKLIEWGVSPQKLSCVKNFIASENIIQEIEEPGRGILYFGRLSKEKGVETLIRASAQSGVSVDIVGDGPEEERLTNLSTRINAPVRFHGRQTGDALWQTVKNSRVTVLPSEWYENCPMSILEGFTFGKPAIGAQIGGIPELIESSGAGWLFKPFSIDSLSKILIKVNELDDNAIKQKGHLASSYVKNFHSEKVYFDHVQDLYKSLGVETGQ